MKEIRVRNVTALVAGIVCFLAPVARVHAQDAPPDTSAKKRELVIGHWYPFLETGLNLSQSSYTANWNGGDNGSVVWAFLLNGKVENQVSSRVNWDNVLKLAFGQTHQQATRSNGERFWEKPDKSTDLIDYETIFRFTLGGFADPYISGRFESQFLDASDPDRSLSFNPLKFRESAGIARKFYDRENLQLLSRLGGTLRQSVRKSFVNPSPDEITQSNTANDGGVEWVTDYRGKVLHDRVSWTSKLSFYKPLFYSGEDELQSFDADELILLGVDPKASEYTKTIDVDWEHIFSTQITKILSVNLYLRWVYDKYDNTVVPVLDSSGNLTNPSDVQAAIRKAGQFKQTLGIGLTYRLF